MAARTNRKAERAGFAREHRGGREAWVERSPSPRGEGVGGAVERMESFESVSGGLGGREEEVVLQESKEEEEEGVVGGVQGDGGPVGRDEDKMMLEDRFPDMLASLERVALTVGDLQGRCARLSHSE